MDDQATKQIAETFSDGVIEKEKENENEQKRKRRKKKEEEEANERGKCKHTAWHASIAFHNDALNALCANEKQNTA